jgi:hypothetical protein
LKSYRSPTMKMVTCQSSSSTIIRRGCIIIDLSTSISLQINKIILSTDGDCWWFSCYHCRFWSKSIEKLQKSDNDNGVNPPPQPSSGGVASSLICPGAPTKRKKSGGSSSREVKWCLSLQTITEVVGEKEEEEQEQDNHLHYHHQIRRCMMTTVTEGSWRRQRCVPKEDPPEVPPDPDLEQHDAVDFGIRF